MNTSFKHKLAKFFRKWWVITGLIILVIIIIAIASGGGANGKMEVATVKIDNVIERVSVTGKVSPVGRADLAFQKGGVVSTIYVKVGDRVTAGSLIASLDSAGDAAALRSAEAQLADLTRGLRPEEYSTYQATVATASTSVSNAAKSAINAAREGYVKAQSAIVNYADQFYSSPQSVNPLINVRVGPNYSTTKLNQEKLTANEALNAWKNELDRSWTDANAQELLTKSEQYLEKLKVMMSNLAVVINELDTNNTGWSQSTINEYVSDMNTGLSNLTSAISSVNTASTNLRAAQSSYAQAANQFTLQRAGSSAEAIAAQKAKVDQARAELNKDFIIAPIDGVITRVEPSVGEFVSAGNADFAIQSDSAFKIEANIPEADIAKVALGNTAEVTLDAYGQDVIFPAMITTIDPAETILEGVPTYKVTLQFTSPDQRIRSGMTANTEILTRKSENVLVVPSRAVMDDDGVKTVRVVNADGETFDTVTVITGLKGSDGTIEIKSGLKEGQKVVTYLK